MSRDSFSGTCHSVSWTFSDDVNQLPVSLVTDNWLVHLLFSITDRAGHTLNQTTMSLKVTLLVASLVSQCWTAPQRRNWTPQAILYLKGAQGHRSVLERHSREEERDALHLDVSNKSGSVVNDPPCLERRPAAGDGLRSSGASLLLLELLQRAVEEGGGRDGQSLNLDNL